MGLERKLLATGPGKDGEVSTVEADMLGDELLSVFIGSRWNGCDGKQKHDQVEVLPEQIPHVLRGLREAMELMRPAIQAEAERIAGEYSYSARPGTLDGSQYFAARCDELRGEDVACAEMDEETAMRRVKEHAVECVRNMLLRGDVPPEPIGVARGEK